MVIYQARLPAGKNFTLVEWPEDDTGPSISFSGLPLLSVPRNSLHALGFMGTMLPTGAVNSN